MKTKKLIPLILTAALALSACAPAAETTSTTATPEPTTTPELTTEPVGKLHALAETGQDLLGNVIYQTHSVVDDEGSFTGTVIYKTDLDARQTTTLYEYNNSTYSTLYQFLANDTLYVVMYRDDSDTRHLHFLTQFCRT